MGNRHAPHAIALAVSLIIAAGACQGDGSSTDSPPGTGDDPAEPPVQPPVTLDVRFLGNSLTYFNDLPATLAAIAAAAGDHIRVQMVAGPKLSLRDHLQSGVAESAIRGGSWDFVVLQQGANTDSASRDSLIVTAQEFDTILRSVGARPALYMVWPPADVPGGFCATRAAYQAAAAAVNGVFLPAGVAWQQALQRDATFPLYDPDGVHPAPLGTYLAAITIYEKLTGHDARKLAPYAVVNGVVLNVPAAVVQLLQGFAHNAASGGTSNYGCVAA